MFDSPFLLFPVHYKLQVIPFSVIVVGIFSLALVSVFVYLFYKPFSASTWHSIIFDALRGPLVSLVCCYAIYSAFDLIQLYFPGTLHLRERLHISHLLSWMEIVILGWFIFRAITLSKRQIQLK